jgi:hypothetical protein
MSSLALAQGQNQANMYTGIANALGSTLTSLAGSGALGGASRMGGGAATNVPSGWSQSSFGFNNGAGWGSL